VLSAALGPVGPQVASRTRPLALQGGRAPSLALPASPTEVPSPEMPYTLVSLLPPVVSAPSWAPLQVPTRGVTHPVLAPCASQLVTRLSPAGTRGGAASAPVLLMQVLSRGGSVASLRFGWAQAHLQASALLASQAFGGGSPSLAAAVRQALERVAATRRGGALGPSPSSVTLRPEHPVSLSLPTPTCLLLLQPAPRSASAWL
jgi:hypothetical protein